MILGRGTSNHENNSYDSRILQGSDGYRLKYLNWDGKRLGEWAKELEGADIVLNLAGKSVNCRYHEKQMREIIESRVNATKIIGEAIRWCVLPPKLWINAASATVYRNYERPNDEFNGIISEMKKDNMPRSFLDRLRYRKNRLVASFLHGKNSANIKT